MLNNKSKALTVVFLTMAAALPGLSMPAAAYLPSQIGAVGSSGPNLDDSNLLTEVRQNYHGNTFFILVAVTTMVVTGITTTMAATTITGMATVITTMITGCTMVCWG